MQFFYIFFQEDNGIYQKALNSIKSLIKPLVTGLDFDEDENLIVKKEDLSVKQEKTDNLVNGT